MQENPQIMKGNNMKNLNNNEIDDNFMREEYDFSESLPNKYAKILKNELDYIKIEPDVQEVFKTSEEVNKALRAIIQAIPKRSSIYNKEKHLAEA